MPALPQHDVRTAAPPVAALADELVRLVKVLAAVKQHAGRRHPGVETGTYALLHALASSEQPIRVGELATRLHSDISTISRQVVPLVDTGLVRRDPDPDDGRAARLSLLPAGRQAVTHAAGKRTALLTEALAGWSAEDVATCHTLLRRLADDLATHLASPAGPSRDRLPPDEKEATA